MGVRTVELLCALRDRPRSTVDELATRLHRDEPDVQSLLTSCLLANVAARDKRKRYSLTRAGRQLLEAHQAREEEPHVRWELMMRHNRGLIAA